MARYKVNHNYRSTRDGVQYGPWLADNEVELTEPDAEWVERDSPGALTAVKAKSTERQQPPTADRQHRGGRNRSA